MSPNVTNVSRDQCETKPSASSRSSKIIRLKKAILFIIAANLAWICLFGQPYELHEIPLGIYQGFNCGWDSVVEDVWTCDRGKDD